MRHRGVLALTLVLLAGSCSSQTVDTTIASGAQIAEPIDLNALAEVLFIDEAEHFQIERAIHDCMEDAGFDYNISPYWPYDMFADADWRVVTNPPPTSGPDNDEEDAYRELRWDISRAQVGWEDAFFGTERDFLDLGNGGGLERPMGGCLDQGWSAVVGDPSVWHELFGRVQGIQGEAYIVAQAAPSAESAADAWMRCMQSRGYDATWPDDLSSDWAEFPRGEEDSEQCRVESGLVEALSEAHGSAITVLLQQHAHTLGPLLATLTDAAPG